MEKKVSQRIQQLAFLLKQQDRIHLREAAQILNVSEMTIRRDLTNVSSIQLLGGHIVPSQSIHHKNYQIFEQQDKNIAEKMQIGKLAASLICEGDVIFFDCGSTIPFIVPHIDPSIKFTALCCSINTFFSLRDNQNCDVILCGGRYSRHNAFLTSIQNSNELDYVCTHKAFISAAGLDLKAGVTCFNFDEAKAKHKAMAKTKQSILLLDHSKFYAVEQAYIGQLEQFDMVICDKPLPAAFNYPCSQVVSV